MAQVDQILALDTHSSRTHNKQQEPAGVEDDNNNDDSGRVTPTEEERNQTPNGKIRPETPVQDGGASRRKSRKNATPKCLKFVKQDEADDDHDLVANNKNMAVDDDEEEDIDENYEFGQNISPTLSNGDIKDLSMKPEVSQSAAINAAAAYEEDEGFGAMDLSVSKPQVSVNACLDLTVNKASKPPPPYHPFKGSAIPPPLLKPIRDINALNRSINGAGPGKDVSDMKVYAESTMNELLSIYGLSNEAQNIVSNVPIQNFSSGRILERLPANAIPPRAKNQINAVPTAADLIIPSNKPSNNVFGALPSFKNKLTTDAVLAHLQAKQIASINNPPQVPRSENESRPSSATTEQSTGQFVKATFNHEAPTQVATSGDISLKSTDYSKYIGKYLSWENCDESGCKDLLVREHYHCLECSMKMFLKKEEMIRHYKWHKKRDDSLQHGFMRYSPQDDCSYSDCAHNTRQTHYHCLQRGCNKVYISTSDVQMHANYHRKDSAIIREGFQRFRATEVCGIPQCAFYGQRTTHFHCRRHGCNFTFKNKADMEKHKTYHQKDEVLAKDGFKKFMKYEHCMFPRCRYSKVSNHIHCIRPGCAYVLLSSGQLYSHKRKHERRDFEAAYRRFKKDHDGLRPDDMPQSSNLSGYSSDQSNSSTNISTSQSESMYPGLPGQGHNGLPYAMHLMRKESDFDMDDMKDYNDICSDSDNEIDISEPTSPGDSRMTPLASSSPVQDGDVSKISGIERDVNLNDSLSLPIPHFKQEFKQEQMESDDMDDLSDGESEVPPSSGRSSIPMVMEKKERDESWKKYLTRYTANDPCRSHCALLYKDHYHCSIINCNTLFRTKERVREHARLHEQEDKIRELTFHKSTADIPCCVDGCNIKEQLHYHCLWPDCECIVRINDQPLTCLQHHRYHEQQRSAVNGKPKFSSANFIDGLRRRRGRPPKYPKDVIPVVPKVEIDSSDVKLENLGDHVKLTREMFDRTPIVNNFKIFQNNEACPDDLCAFYTKEHFHCVRPRCHHVTNSVDVINLHAREFHNYVTILDGFEFFDRGVSCRRPHCANNRANRHFHCIRPRCDYAFVRHSTMFQHDKKHHDTTGEFQSQPNLKPPTISDELKAAIVKASGTYYPISTIPPQKLIAPKPTPGEPVIPVKFDANMLKKMSQGFPGMGFIPGFPTPFWMPPGSTGGSPILINMPISSAALNLSPITTIQSSASATSVTSSKGEAGISGPISAAAAAAAAEALSGDSPMNLSEGAPSVTGYPTSTFPASSFPAMAFAASVPAASIAQSTAQPSNAQQINLLLQQQVEQQKAQDLQNTVDNSNVESWANLKARMHFELDSMCGRPFCKLKKREHFHCFDCNQAFSDSERLKIHIGRHGIKFERMHKKPKLPLVRKLSMDYKGRPEHPEDLSSSLNLNAEAFSTMVVKAQAVHHPMDSSHVLDDDSDSEGMLSIDLGGNEAMTPQKRPLEDDDIDADAIVIKQRRIASPRVNKDEPVPDGYIRFFAHEDCMCRGCSYRQSTTHFHCKRPSCMFGICSRARIDQHSVRHQRIDKVMGDEFEQFRANLNCGYTGCIFATKATHFHCLKCNYTCTDTIKVTGHRKQHLKKDFFIAQGFRKCGITNSCGSLGCKYDMKQTHYHCTHLDCDAAVVGQAQMPPHRLKHIDIPPHRRILMSPEDSNQMLASGLGRIYDAGQFKQENSNMTVSESNDDSPSGHLEDSSRLDESSRQFEDSCSSFPESNASMPCNLSTTEPNVH